MPTISQSTLKVGAFIAVSAAVLVMNGFANAADKDSGDAKVHGSGAIPARVPVNAKRQKAPARRQNVCKGHSFLSMSAKDCEARDGKKG